MKNIINVLPKGSLLKTTRIVSIRNDNFIELIKQKVKEALLKKTGCVNTIIDYDHKIREELIVICKERNMNGYSGKKRKIL